MCSHGQLVLPRAAARQTAFHPSAPSARHRSSCRWTSKTGPLSDWIRRDGPPPVLLTRLLVAHPKPLQYLGKRVGPRLPLPQADTARGASLRTSPGHCDVDEVPAQITHGSQMPNRAANQLPQDRSVGRRGSSSTQVFPLSGRTSLASTAQPQSETTPIYKAGFWCRARSSVKKSSIEGDDPATVRDAFALLWQALRRHWSDAVTASASTAPPTPRLSAVDRRARRVVSAALVRLSGTRRRCGRPSRRRSPGRGRGPGGRPG